MIQRTQPTNPHFSLGINVVGGSEWSDCRKDGEKTTDITLEQTLAHDEDLDTLCAADAADAGSVHRLRGR